MKNSPIKSQRLGKKSMIAFLTMMIAFPALSTDLYLPALPEMSSAFHVSATLTNMTLISFFVTSAIMTLAWGPLSDKYGRRPILIVGSICYLGASLLCMLSWNIWVLIAARILQATGGAAATAMGIAVVKDVYSGKQREKILAIVNSMVIICPVAAPVIGAFMLNITSWRGIFLLQTVFGALVLGGSLLFSETIGERLTSGILTSLSRLIVVAKNKSFSLLVTAFSVQNAASLGFIGVSSYIYQTYYGLSSQVYSFFFSFNALCMAGGPFIYTLLSRYFHKNGIITSCYIVSMASGIAVICLADFGPFAFALSLMPSFVAASCIKPPGISLMLDMQSGDTGSASSIINAMGMLMGTLGIYIASINIWDFAHLVGAVTITLNVVAVVFWAVFRIISKRHGTQ